jgi:tetratricopeptide (TPR) repeat protein
MQAAGGQGVIDTVYNAGFRLIAAIRETTVPESSSLYALTRSIRPDAVTALISAREFLARQSVEDIEAAAYAARLAIRLDASYAAAWATLAEIRICQAVRSLRPAREAGWLAREAAQTALHIDPASTCALAIVGWVRVLIEHDGKRGMADLDRAFAMDQDYWMVTLLRGWALQAAGRLNEAVKMLRRTQELNPVSYAVHALLPLFLLLAGSDSEAVSLSQELARRFPSVDNAQGIASVIASVSGQHDEAIAYGWQALRLAPHTPLMHAPLASALAFSGRQEEARSVLKGIEESHLPLPSAALAPVYLALGERPKAVSLLQHACEHGMPQLAWSRDDPRLAALRGEPAVERLWQRIGGSAALAA